MSARRVLGTLALALAAGAALARPARAAAADSIVVQVGGQLAARAGQTIMVPVTVDMRGAPGRTLGGYALTVAFDTAVFYWYGDSNGTFAAPLVNSDSAFAGRVRYTAILPAGATGVITLFSLELRVRTDTVVSPITVSPTQLTAASGSVVPFEDLLPITRVVNGAFCRALGTWGDVDGDGQENSRDALAALSEVVGLPIDTTLMNPALSDVDGDGRVTSRDALIILSYAVGLDVSGYRLGQVAAGACATGNATLLAIVPDSLELSAGQLVPIVVRATDSTGRAVPIPSLTWTSSNSGVAAFVDNTNLGAAPIGHLGPMAGFYYGAGIQARQAGTATVTATMAPGVSATIKVVVLAHRHTWYVDVRRARNVATQVGSQAWPFEFVGDAMDGSIVQDGDSVLIAGGTYDERVSSSVSVILVGDSTDRPVIDARGDPNYSPSSDAVAAGSRAGTMSLEHVVVRGGGVYFDAHDMLVRDVDIQMLGGTGTGLELYSEPAASLGVLPGNVRVDRVTLDGAPSDGIRVDQADSALITNNTLARDSSYTGTCSVYSGTTAAIGVQSQSYALVQGNTVLDAACAGVAVYQAAGRAVVSRNTIVRPSGVGIAGSAPTFLTDHNAIRTVANAPGNLYQDAYGIYVDNASPVDSFRSLADTVVGVHGYYPYAAVYVRDAALAQVDSLRADSIGDPGTSSYGNGVEAYGGRIRVTGSRITNLVGAGIQAGSLNFEFASQGNLIARAQSGITFSANCDCSASPDTATSTGDSILITGGHAIDFAYAHVARVQGAVIDSSNAYGVYLYGYTSAPSAAILNSKISRTNTAISAAGMAALQIAGDSLLNNGTGAFIQSSADTVRVSGTIVSGGSSGLSFWYSPFVMDSSAVLNTLEGFHLDGGYGGFITRSRFQADSAAVVMGYSPRSLTVSGSTFQGNQVAVDNEENATDTVWVYAAGNFWGIGNGPTCDSVAYGSSCPGNGTTTGDSLKSYLGTALRVDYSGYLSTPPTPTGAPRAFASSPVRRAAPAPAPQRLVARPLVTSRQLPASSRPVAAPRGRHPFPPPWQKGRRPRATRVP